MTLWDEIRHLDTSRKALRSFGLLVGVVFLGIAGIVLWKRAWTPGTAVYVLGGLGAGLVLFGAVAPSLLTPIYRAWMALAFVLGFVMTRVLLTAVFYLLVLPIGLFLRLRGTDPLHRRLEPDAPSYWIPKEYRDPSAKRLEKYY